MEIVDFLFLPNMSITVFDYLQFCVGQAVFDSVLNLNLYLTT